MRTTLTLVAALAIVGCAQVDEQGNPLAVEQAAPSQTLTLTVTDPAYPTGPFDILVTGAAPGDNVKVVLGLGGLGAGACYPALGGNCMDILPNPNNNNYKIIRSGNADATGTFAVSGTLPASVPVGNYALQAVVIAGAASNESPAITMDVTAFCPTDAFEPNDDMAGAYLNPAATFTAISCDGNDDWFGFDVPDSTEFDFHINFDGSADGDVDMTLYDAAGTYLDGSGSISDDEYLYWLNQTGAAATVYANVYTFSDYDGNGTDYAGDSMTTPYTPPPPLPTLTDDVNEPDDDTASATAVTTFPFSQTGLNSTDDGTAIPDEDVDFFAVNVVAGQTITSNIYFLDADADIDLFIIEEAAMPVAPYTWNALDTAACSGGTTVSDNETASCVATVDGVVYIAVAMWEEAGGLVAPNIFANGAEYDIDIDVF